MNTCKKTWLLKAVQSTFQIVMIRNNSTISRLIPRRALMYVPGDDERKLNKTLTLDRVDCISFDCEDGVALNKKSDARNKIRTFLEANHNNVRFSNWAVRINSVDTEYFENDIKTLYSSPSAPKTILLPKTNNIDFLQPFEHLLQETKKIKEPVNLIFYAETCEGVINLNEICKKAMEMSERNKIFKPVGIVFGSDDFLASIGALRTEGSVETLYARQKTVLIAKAYELQAIDMVYIDYKNDAGLEKQCLEGAQFGYTGKQIIHPNQIDIVQKAFTPSPEKYKWALDLINAFEKHQDLGKGAFTFHSQMIDMPTVRQAYNIVQTVENVN